MIKRIFRRKTTQTDSKKASTKKATSDNLNAIGIGNIGDGVSSASDLMDDAANGSKLSDGSGDLASGKKES